MRFADILRFHDDVLYLFGGRSNSYTNKLHSLNTYTGEWKLYPPGNEVESPMPCYGASMVLYSNKLFVFGGYTPLFIHRITLRYDANGFISGDVFCYDLVIQTWRQVIIILGMNVTFKVLIKPGRQKPPPRFHHSCVVHGCNMVVFGGCTNGSRQLNDSWVFGLSSFRINILTCKTWRIKCG